MISINLKLVSGLTIPGTYLILSMLKKTSIFLFCGVTGSIHAKALTMHECVIVPTYEINELQSTLTRHVIDFDLILRSESFVTDFVSIQKIVHNFFIVELKTIIRTVIEWFEPGST